VKNGEIVGYRYVSRKAGIAELLLKNDEGKIEVIPCDSSGTQRALDTLFPTGCYLGETVAFATNELGCLCGIGHVDSFDEGEVA